ncbi:uncharacterized protein FOMMEDRAFT_154065 [Fomitiporia mediterranea MF3/22]|uniref:uncharacterized protein n=1 Tax=Fomitiporia mediterranea (strain MF3/22) TaxID=694068 RepID=UPI0004407EDD|nr:uncharacterized protein FOMMEDRAFT_154065 [Fomitiporia mediterranea MF3/22]EJD04914.1 hypothetical protein FOMMEDRAFT_154065 [Fomitiporia mediterranea MF3/22]
MLPSTASQSGREAFPPSSRFSRAHAHEFTSRDLMHNMPAPLSWIRTLSPHADRYVPLLSFTDKTGLIVDALCISPLPQVDLVPILVSVQQHLMTTLATQETVTMLTAAAMAMVALFLLPVLHDDHSLIPECLPLVHLPISNPKYNISRTTLQRFCFHCMATIHAPIACPQHKLTELDLYTTFRQFSAVKFNVTPARVTDFITSLNSGSSNLPRADL